MSYTKEQMEAAYWEGVKKVSSPPVTVYMAHRLST